MGFFELLQQTYDDNSIKELIFIPQAQDISFSINSIPGISVTIMKAIL
jgi:hypothetical protein